MGEPYGPSPVLPATQSSVFTKAKSPKELKNLIIFPSRTSASLMIKHRRPETMSVFQTQAAVCIDPAAGQLLREYVTKLNEISKWRQKWDGYDHTILSTRAMKGQVRNGAGECQPWTYGVDESPPYNPRDKDGRGFAAVDMQATELMDYAKEVFDIPESYWRNDSTEGNAARAADDFFNTAGFGEVRRSVLLRLIRARYGIPKCSFTTPQELYVQDDVYYFPEGAAFGRPDKVPVYAAAYILTMNPNSRMADSTKERAEKFLQRGALMDAARVPAIAPPEADTFVSTATGSSSSTTTAPAVKKKPAATKTNTGPAAKKK